MLYLLTGKPGSGKTLHMVSMLMKRDDLKGRPLYIDGIPDVDPVKIPHEALPENCTGENWQEWLPQNAILVVDECQRYWRARPNGSKVPEAVQAIETHRHRGVDLFFITQHPRLIDTNIKSFVENHKHFDKTQLGTRRMWEWQRCGNPDSLQDINTALSKPYKLDKDAFSAYKSAELHTKIKVNRSKWVWGFPLLLVVTVAMIYYAYVTNRKILHSSSETTQTAAASAAVAPAGALAGAASATQANAQAGQYNAVQPQENVKVLKASDFAPSIDGKPWTAPAYAPHNTNIQTMPYPVACVKSGRKCTCYTDQATPIRGMDKGLCIDYAENGIYNPYKAAQQTQSDAVPNNETKLAKGG